MCVYCVAIEVSLQTSEPPATLYLRQHQQAKCALRLRSIQNQILLTDITSRVFDIIYDIMRYMIGFMIQCDIWYDTIYGTIRYIIIRYDIWYDTLINDTIRHMILILSYLYNSSLTHNVMHANYSEGRQKHGQPKMEQMKAQKLQANTGKHRNATQRLIYKTKV